MFERHLWKSVILSKMQVDDLLKCHSSKNQLPGLSMSGTLVDNGLIRSAHVVQILLFPS